MAKERSPGNLSGYGDALQKEGALHQVLTEQSVAVICVVQNGLFQYLDIAAYPDDGVDRDALFQKAHFAMSRAKAAGPNRWMC